MNFYIYLESLENFYIFLGKEIQVQNNLKS